MPFGEEFERSTAQELGGLSEVRRVPRKKRRLVSLLHNLKLSNEER
jgi:hypothetical protein